MCALGHAFFAVREEPALQRFSGLRKEGFPQESAKTGSASGTANMSKVSVEFACSGPPVWARNIFPVSPETAQQFHLDRRPPSGF